MKTLKVDVQLSYEFADIYRDIIEENECYTNIANIAIEPFRKSLDDNIMIAFGGFKIEGFSNAYAKHAFFINDGYAVDPTQALKSLNEDIDYIVVEEMTLDEYRDYLAEHQHTFPKDMHDKLNQASLELHLRNIVLYG